MSYYFAKFKKEGAITTREMTRIYFSDIDPDEKKDRCIGVVIAKNPGSAKPKKLDVLYELDLEGDRMLPWISNAFTNAFNLINYEPPQNAYVRILNLFSICNPDLSEAMKSLDSNSHKLENAKSDLEKTPLIFLAWGSEQNLVPYRAKWLKELNLFKDKVFFFAYTVTNRKYHYICKSKELPSISDKVKHPQGLPQKLAIEQIAKYFH